MRVPIIALVAVVAACGKKTDPPDATAPPADTAAPPPTDAAAPPPADAAAPTLVDAAAAPPDATMQPPDAAAAPDVGPTPDISSAGLPPMVLPEGAVTVSGFAQPESVYFVDEIGKPDWYIVSNINGSPFDKDDNGFLSKLNADGTIAALKWIDGAAADVTLDAPKGMAVKGKDLWVADIDVVRRFELATGTPLADVPVPGATFLNDVAFGEGVIIVSDSGIDKSFAPTKSAGLYYIDDKLEVSKMAAEETPPVAGYPNGVAAIGEAIAWVGIDGTKKLHRTNQPETLSEQSFDVGAGMLDGVAFALHSRDNASYLVTSWEKHALIEVVELAEGPPSTRTILENIKGPADFAFTSDHRVALPVMEENLVVIFKPTLTELPIPADWNELGKLLGRAMQQDRKTRTATLVDETWGVYVMIVADMVGPGPEFDDAGNELPPKKLDLPKGKWLARAQILDRHDDESMYYTFFEPIEAVEGSLDDGDPLCDVATLTCDMGSHPTGTLLRFAKNKAGETKLVGILVYDSPPDEAYFAKNMKRFNGALAKKLK